MDTHERLTMLERLMSKLLHFPEWCGDRVRKWERNLHIKHMRSKADIGEFFCYRSYNDMEGSRCKIFNLNVREKIRIGNYVKLNGTLFCNKKAQISIGDYTVIRSGTVINADNAITIGKSCFISGDVLIYDNNGHPLSPHLRAKQIENLHITPIENYEAENAPITIGNDVWIGIRAIILKGVTIGDGSVVAAGAVVTKDVPARTIVAGNPARVVKKIS